MCVQVTKTSNRFEISSLLEKILLKQVMWCLTFVGVHINYTIYKKYKDILVANRSIDSLGDLQYVYKG